MMDRIRAAENLVALILIGWGVAELRGVPTSAIVMGALWLLMNALSARRNV